MTLHYDGETGRQFLSDGMVAHWLRPVDGAPPETADAPQEEGDQ